jgi:hypothetical protein
MLDQRPWRRHESSSQLEGRGTVVGSYRFGPGDSSLISPVATHSNSFFYRPTPVCQLSPHSGNSYTPAQLDTQTAPTNEKPLFTTDKVEVEELL